MILITLDVPLNFFALTFCDITGLPSFVHIFQVAEIIPIVQCSDITTMLQLQLNQNFLKV